MPLSSGTVEEGEKCDGQNSVPYYKWRCTTDLYQVIGHLILNPFNPIIVFAFLTAAAHWINTLIELSTTTLRFFLSDSKFKPF